MIQRLLQAVRERREHRQLALRARPIARVHELLDQPVTSERGGLQLAGAFCNPKPVQRPYPPIMTGGRSAPILRVTAEHADLWNIPGGDIDDAARRSARLDRYCAEIGRDPASITRSIVLAISYDHPDRTRVAIAEALAAGFRHIVLSVPSPYPDGVARWIADELVTG